MGNYVYDFNGKKAYVRRSATPGDLQITPEPTFDVGTWDWYVNERTGRYYVVAAAR